MNVKSGSRGLRAALLSASSLLAAAVLAAGTAGAITIGNGYTPGDAVDNEGGVNGVGQWIADNGGGTIGLCTGTLINPRTVIFAAHCANSRPASAYGVGGVDVAFFFNVNNRNVGGVDALLDWYFAATRTSNAALNYFAVNQVYYHPESLEPAARSFLYADVALASLEAPAVGIPTWALLFSPLPVPEAIDPVTGTGYHVDITGYGRNGTGLTGSANAIDYRRRAAENMIGALTSLEIFELWLFGGAPNGLGQNLYFIDFDSPGGTYPFDFNAFRDDALDREGGTAGGDSGGPMILDAANNSISTRDLVIGVLSGGYGRFFNGQPAAGNGYGSVSFYQPLYLYWDFIVANNPYRYVSALAGDGAWEDGAHWQVTLDPNYMIIGDAGTAVNGVPTNPGAGQDGDEPMFGQLCFGPPSSPVIECIDTATGDYTVELQTGIADASMSAAESNAGSARIADLFPELVDNAARVNILDTTLEAHAVYSPDPLPAPSLANGLPGATNFVPNNVDPTAGGTVARYYDVTLSAAGTTTLSSVVTVDRLAVVNTAGLRINAAGNLTSLIDITQAGGTVHVDGRLATAGDYSLFAGRLSGTGTVVTPFLTNFLGGIAPGTQGTVGTLRVDGSVILTSGSGFLVDIGSAVSADRLTVTGALNLGGTFVATTVGGFLPAFGQSWTVASGAGGVTGSFSAVGSNFTGVLRPELRVVGNNVILNVAAASFVSVGSFTSPEQVVIAEALDAIRGRPGGYTALSSLYGSLDLTNPSALDEAFESLVPLNAYTTRGLAEASVGLYTKSIVDRADQLSAGGGHGFDASSAAAMLNHGTLQASADPFDAMMMGSAAVIASQEAVAETMARAGRMQLREGWGGFLDITTTLDSKYATTPFAGDADLDATSGTIGLDYGFSDGSFAGFALSYVTADAELAVPLQSAEAESWGVTVFGGVHEGDSFLNGYVGYSGQSYDLSRTVPLMMGAQVLTGSPDGSTWAAGAKLGFRLDSSAGTFTPYAAIDAKWISIDGYTESGGSAAVTFDNLDTTLIDARLGLEYAGTFDMGDGSVLRPKLGVAYVIDVQSDDNILNTAFAAFPAVPLTFIGTDRHSGWFEYQAALEYEGPNFGLAITYTGGDNGLLKYNTLGGRVSFAW